MTDEKKPNPGKFGTRTIDGKTTERPALDIDGIEYEHSAQVVYRKLPNIPTVIVAVTPGKRCGTDRLEQLEAEYKAAKKTAASDK